MSHLERAHGFRCSQVTSVLQLRITLRALKRAEWVKIRNYALQNTISNVGMIP